MSLKSIYLENFTVFKKTKIDFNEGINIFIGDNGTGKTHLLKTLYSFCECESGEKYGKKSLAADFMTNLTGCFQIGINALMRFRTVDSDEKSMITIESEINTLFDKYEFEIEEAAVPRIFGMSLKNEQAKKRMPSVFIPAKDMLTHSGIEKDFIQRNLPFDITLIDILNKAGISSIKDLDKEMVELLEKIANVIGGKICYDNSQYYIERQDGNRIDFATEAEGFKKLGLLYRLIETGNITKGSILFWDEPESNINPQNIPDLVDIILALHKKGVQIFITTHDYFLAKYFNIRKRGDDNMIYHALYKSKDGVLHECAEEFSDLENNSIVNQSIDMYKEEVKKVML